MIVLNKADLADGEEHGAEKLAQLKLQLEAKDYKVFVVSGAARMGLLELKIALWDLVREERRQFEAELASRLPVVKGLMSAASLGLEEHGMMDFKEALADGRAFRKTAKQA